MVLQTMNSKIPVQMERIMTVIYCLIQMIQTVITLQELENYLSTDILRINLDTV